MKIWIKPSPKLAHNFYRIPSEIAMGDDNIFYGMEHHPYDLDGPWPLLAFLQNKEYPNVATFHIYNVHPSDLEFESFNPLVRRVRGYLTLKHQALTGLIDILREYSQRLSSTPNKRQKMFRSIQGTELADLHLHPEWFPKSKKNHYYQIYDPLVKKEKYTIATILILSIDRTVPSVLFFKIVSFPLGKLQNPSFTPLDDSLARINLDRNGMEELITLLQMQLGRLAK